MTTTAPPIPVEYVDVYDGEGAETVRLAVLPLAAIFIPRFQRERKAHHKKIAAEFDRSAWAFPVVFEYRGTFAALDGQQRLAAAEILGETMVVVLLVEGIASETRAAALYLRFNRDRRGLNAIEKFIGAHAANDPGTLQVTRILDEVGLRAGKSAAASNMVPAGAVMAIHEHYGDDVLSRVLLIRELAWGDANDRTSRESKTLRGLAMFLRSYWDKVDDNVLATVLRRVHPASLLSKTSVVQGSFETRYSDAVRSLYNSKMPSRKGKL